LVVVLTEGRQNRQADLMGTPDHKGLIAHGQISQACEGEANCRLSISDNEQPCLS
jgi:hypothetical protein